MTVLALFITASLVQVWSTSGSASSRSIYPTNRSSCEASGFCAWLRWDLENKYYEFECVPSERYITQRLRLNTTQMAVPRCYDLEENVEACSKEPVCRYNYNGSDAGCYYPSLQILYDDTTALLDLKPELKRAAVTEPMACAQYVTNVSCLAPGRHCIWDPADNFTVTNSANVSEKQGVTLRRPIDLTPSSSPIQLLSIEAPAFDRSRMTVTRLMLSDGSQVSGSFRFGLKQDGALQSKILAFNATASEVEAALNEVISVEGGEVESVAKEELAGFAAWQVTFRAGSERFRESVVITDIQEVIPQGAPADAEDTQHIVLTRHQRNTQRLTIYALNGLDGGEFLLYYNGVETPQKMRFDASAEDVALQLLSLQISGVNPLQYVYVSLADTNAIEPMNGLPPARSWMITFTTQVLEYEPQERLLEVGLAGEGCAGCSVFSINGTVVNASAARTDLIPLIPSPRINGTFRAQRCIFNNTLDGIAFPTVGEDQVYVFSQNPFAQLSVPIPGDPISIGRSLMEVAAVKPESTQPSKLGLRHAYTLFLEMPYDGYEVQEDYGVDIYSCHVISSAPFTPHASLAQMMDALGGLWPGKAASDVISITQTSAPNELNEAQWEVTLLDVVERTPVLQGVYDKTAEVSTEAAFDAALVVTEVGEANPSGVRGSFRLAFAGFYRGAENNYVPVRLAHLTYEDAPGCVLNNEELTQINCDSPGQPYTQDQILLCFTAPIPWNATAQELEAALREVCNLASSPDEAIQVGVNITGADAQKEVRRWTVDLGLYYPSDFLVEDHGPDARFAQLYVISKVGLEGAGIDVTTEKINGLSSFRFNSSGIEQVFTGDLMQQTPCMINRSYQLEVYPTKRVNTLFTDLDASLDACSQGDESFSACGNLSVESIQERSFYSKEREFLQLNCVWRGDVPRTNDFSWGPRIYRGRTYRAIESRCTVPLTEVSYVLTQLYFQSGDLDNNDIYRDTYDLGVRFLDCGRLIIITPQAVISTEQWYQIIIVTVGICGASYAIAAMRLSYVISDHSLFTPKSFIKIPKLLIFCAASCFYGVITAFAYTCIPALLITQVYNDNRDPEEVLRISISFGCILAIYIIYFELGRGHIMK